MFDFTLKMKCTENKVILNQPRSYYIVFSIILIILLGSAIYSGLSFLSAFFILLILILLTYQENWTFHRENQTLSYKVGVLFLYKRLTQPFNELKNAEVTGFTKGRRDEEEKKLPFYMKRQYILNLYTIEGHNHTLFIADKNQRENMESIAREINRFIQK